MGEKIDVPVGDIIDAIVGLVARYADPAMVPPGRKHRNGVQVLYGKGEKEGRVMFIYTTSDGHEVRQEVVLSDVIYHGREYIENMFAQAMMGLDDARRRTQELTRAVINTTQVPN